MDLKALHSFLERRTKRPLHVRLNDNLHSLLTVTRPRGRPARVSVHRMFLDAPPCVLDALVDFILGPTDESRAEVRRFIWQNNSRLAPSEAHKVLERLEPVGRHFDLQVISDRLNRHYFQSRLEFVVSWGKRPVRPPRSLAHIQLGNYNERLNLIRIHPILDSPFVPLFFVEYIIYHEMVHILVRPEADERGRVYHHTRKFYALERKFEDYQRAVRWQSRHIDELAAHYCSRPRRQHVRQLSLF